MKYLCILSILLLGSCDSKSQDINTLKTNPEYEKLIDTDKFIGDHKAKVMILGTFHFANPGLDSYKPKKTVNIFSEKRQQEIEEVLEKIAQFKPTKILIEANRIQHDSVFNDRYSKYLKNEFDISNRSNELYQLGFKLAKKMNHDSIYSSDASAVWFGADLDWDNYDGDAYSKSKGQYHKVMRYEADFEALSEYEDSMKMSQTLNEYFIATNSIKANLKSHQIYLTGTILEGAGDNYVGADAVAKWYRRNIRIFSNVYDMTDFSKEERILMIYGGGHVWQLRQFFKDSPDYDFIEVNDYLTK